MSITDPRLSSLLEAAEKVDRASLGFTPIPTTGNVRVEWARGIYDVMLHMDYHEIAFRRTPSGYLWIWEQEEFIGPKKWKAADGPENEQITITFQTVNLSGGPVNKLYVTYTGPDERLLKSPNNFLNFDLTLAQVAPIIRQWNSASTTPK